MLSPQLEAVSVISSLLSSLLALFLGIKKFHHSTVSSQDTNKHYSFLFSICIYLIKLDTICGSYIATLSSLLTAIMLIGLLLFVGWSLLLLELLTFEPHL